MERDSILESNRRPSALRPSCPLPADSHLSNRLRPNNFRYVAAFQKLASVRQVRARFALILLALVVGGCATVSLPPANLKEPGWTVREGQAIWRRKSGGEGIAGDILVATRPDGQAFVQFSKTPFPLLVAQSTPKAWTFDIPPQNKHYSGHGHPPQRIIFLQLPQVLIGRSPPKHWTWRTLANGGWQLENGASGESLDVYFNP